MVNMVIRKSRHGVVTMIVVGLEANIDAFDARLLGNFLQVFGQKLTLLVKVVSGPLVE